jgi:hypothetical protein
MKNHGKITAGPMKDRDITSNQEDGFTAVMVGATQVACIGDKSGVTVEDVIKSITPTY